MADHALIALLCTALETAPALPAGLAKYTEDPSAPYGAELAAAACRRDDLDLDTRGRLTHRAALDPDCPYAGKMLATFVSAQIVAGADPLESLREAWDTPAGQGLEAVVLAELRGTPAQDAVTAAILSSRDQNVLRLAALVDWAAVDQLTHLLEIWDSTDDVEMRKTVLHCGQLLMPAVARDVRAGFAAWWQTIPHDELVLHWAARATGNGQWLDPLRIAAVERVLPAWFAGSLPGASALHAANALVEKTLHWWKEDFLTAMAAEAAELNAPRDSVRADLTRRILREVQRRAEIRSAASLDSVLKRPLWQVSGSQAAPAWLLDSLPDTPAAWAALIRIGAVGAGERSTWTLAALVATTRGVLA